MRNFGYKKLPILNDFKKKNFFGSKLTMILTVIQGWVCILWKSKQLIYMFAPKSYYLIHTFFFSFACSALFRKWTYFPKLESIGLLSAGFLRLYLLPSVELPGPHAEVKSLPKQYWNTSVCRTGPFFLKDWVSDAHFSTNVPYLACTVTSAVVKAN